MILRLFCFTFAQFRQRFSLLIVPVLLVLLIVIGLTISGWSLFVDSIPVQQKERVKVERITITPRGFEPSEITLPKGKVIFAVDNRSGLPEINLQFDRVAGSRLKQVKVLRQKLDWAEGFDLTPGSYILTEANHPEWVCHITIAAR